MNVTRICRLPALVLLALLAIAAATVAPTASAADEDQPTAVASAATALLKAINKGDGDALRELVGPLAERDVELARAIDIQQFRLDRTWIADKQAHIQFRWIACFDHEKFAAATLPELEAMWRNAGANVRDAADQYRAKLVQLRALIEEPEQVMVLARYGAASWRPTNQWFGAVAPADGNPVELHGSVEFLEPEESECGGATPEAVTARVVAAWKARNTVDVVWCSQPGEPRRWYATTDKTMLLAMQVEEYSVHRVWIRGNMAWVEYRWKARFLERPYFEHMARELQADPEHQKKPDGEKRAAMQALFTTVQQLKATIEQGTHFMRLRRHGDRWYNAGDPIGTKDPDWEPVRDASAAEGSDEGDE